MKIITALSLCLFLHLAAHSQQPRITWGEEFKMTKGSTDLEVIWADKTGVYLQEGHMALKGYYVFAATVRSSATLVKLTPTLTEVYRNAFDKELKGKEFEQFFTFGGKLYLMARTLQKREKKLTLWVATINTANGELQSDWQSFAEFDLAEKDDEFRYKTTYNADSSRLILVSNLYNKEHNSFSLRQYDKTLKPVGRPTNIYSDFEAKTYELEDMLVTGTNKVLMVGRVYAYEEGKRKRDKFLDFSHYAIRLYDEGGKKIATINTEIKGKWLISTKVLQEKNNDLVLAAFYSNSRKGKDINGLLVQRIDPNTGTIRHTSQKELNTGLITAAEADDSEAANESRQERKEREEMEKIKNENEAFSRFMRFNNMFYTPDGGVVLLAEKFHRYEYASTSYSGGATGMATTQTRWYTVYECGDLMMCKIDASGNIGWLNVLPKEQREVIRTGTSNGSGGISLGFSYFTPFNHPFYAGFGTLQNKNGIHMLFNDHARNENVTQLGQKVKQTRMFSKTDGFIVTLDPVTGAYTRKMLYRNTDVPTSMPRLGVALPDAFYMLGKEDRVLGKSKIAVARISFPK